MTFFKGPHPVARGDHICSGLDLIRDDGVAAAVELIDAVYLDGVGARAADVCAMELRKFARSTMCGSRASRSRLSSCPEQAPRQ